MEIADMIEATGVAGDAHGKIPAEGGECEEAGAGADKGRASLLRPRRRRAENFAWTRAYRADAHHKLLVYRSSEAAWTLCQALVGPIDVVAEGPGRRHFDYPGENGKEMILAAIYPKLSGYRLRVEPAVDGVSKI